MPIAAESVTLAGSNLVFQNTYGEGVTEAYRSAIIAAENAFQSHFANAATVSMNFDLQAMSAAYSAHNEYAVVAVSYGAFVAALTAHATTADDLIAVAGLPTADPSHGLGFWLPAVEARVLGLASQGDSVDDTITLNSNLSFTYGGDAIGVLEHEISEGVFGRVSSLGLQQVGWQPMDLFRFDAHGHRDLTGGADGAATFFGIDGAHLTNLQFHNSISASGADDGYDLADWDHTSGDAFGPGGPGAPGTMSAGDLQALDVLGWTPASTSGSSQTSPTGPASPSTSGAVGGQSLAATSASTEVHGGTGNDTISGAPVADYLRGDDGNDSISGGSAFDDINGNQGADIVHGNAGDDWVVGGKDNDMLFGDAGGDIVWGNLGADTLDGGDGVDQVRGGQGDDSLAGGGGADFISGDRGADTESGGAGADTFHFSQDAGVDRVLDFNYAGGDRVQLDPGTTYGLYQVGADTIVDTGNGNEMVLVGVQLSSLPADWIFGA